MITRRTRGVRAPHGEKMIEVKVRFWTDKIAGKGKVSPRHARTAGVVRMEGNESHGIKPKQPRPFNSILEIPAVIERVLIEHGISLHRSRKARKYIV